MSTIVYQDFQSCFDSHVVKTTTLKLRVTTPTNSIESNIENINEKYQSKCSFNKNHDLGGGWNSIQNLSTNNDSMEKGNDSYVYPLSKKSSSSRLSEKSLALCTENLGSETGTDNIIENNIFTYSSPPSSTQETNIQVEPPLLLTTKYKVMSSASSNNNVETSRKLPPPLTTLRGLNSLHVQPHREGGRLVIKAVEAPTMHTYLQAERSNGRLRLCFLKDESSDTTIDEANEELKVENDSFESEISDEEEEDDEEENYMNMKRDIDGNSYDVEVESGIGKYQSVRRCNKGRQDNKEFCDWGKPLWVATS